MFRSVVPVTIAVFNLLFLVYNVDCKRWDRVVIEGAAMVYFMLLAIVMEIYYSTKRTNDP